MKNALYRASMPMPARYRGTFVEVAVDAPPIVMTASGPRPSVGYRWKCNRCGKVIKQNTAAAQSHIAKHVREASPSVSPEEPAQK